MLITYQPQRQNLSRRAGQRQQPATAVVLVSFAQGGVSRRRRRAVDPRVPGGHRLLQVLQDAEFVLVVDTVFLQVLQRGVDDGVGQLLRRPGVRAGRSRGARFFFADGLAAGLLWLAPGVAAAAEVSCVAST